MAITVHSYRDAESVAYHARLRGFQYLQPLNGRIVLLRDNPYPHNIHRFTENGCLKIGGDDSLKMIAVAMESGQSFNFESTATES